MLFLQMLTAQQHLFEANGAHRYQVFLTGAWTHGLFWRPAGGNEKERKEVVNRPIFGRILVY